MLEPSGIAGPHKKRYLQDTLLEWYSGNSRDFPWRKGNASNYQIIISEIFLQRTRAETVARFYPIFFSRFPDWESLCKASLQDIETTIQPLGLYKQRSTKIYQLAFELKSRGFQLPDSRNEAHDAGLSGLYISNAFELFVLKKRAALLDVNMARILSRYFEYKNTNDLRIDKQLQNLSSEIINVWNCKELNWAFLDFAALICTARKPSCTKCPLKKQCSHHNYTITNEIEEIGTHKVNIQVISKKKNKTSKY